MGFSFGWNKQPYDSRDYRLVVPQARVETQTIRVVPPIWDQGQLGSCTAHGSLAVFVSRLMVEGRPYAPLSRLQVYYDTRRIDGDPIREDSGGTIRSAVKALSQYGAAPETLWPYNERKFASKPPAKVYAAAKHEEALAYQAVSPTVQGMKNALAAGFPVVFGFTVNTSFMDTPSSGLVPKTAGCDEGGHCVAAFGFSDGGYDDSLFGHIPAGTFVVRNSWGADWGRSGYCFMPYAMLAECEADDFWVITDAGDPSKPKGDEKKEVSDVEKAH